MSAIAVANYPSVAFQSPNSQRWTFKIEGKTACISLSEEQPTQMAEAINNRKRPEEAVRDMREITQPLILETVLGITAIQAFKQNAYSLEMVVGNIHLLAEKLQVFNFHILYVNPWLPKSQITTRTADSRIKVTKPYSAANGTSVPSLRKPSLTHHNIREGMRGSLPARPHQNADTLPSPIPDLDLHAQQVSPEWHVIKTW